MKPHSCIGGARQIQPWGPPPRVGGLYRGLSRRGLSEAPGVGQLSSTGTECQWGLQQLCKSCRTCFKFYCMFYFTCDRSFSWCFWLQVWALKELATCRSKDVTGTAAVSRVTRATWPWSARASSLPTTTSSAPTVTATSNQPTNRLPPTPPFFHHPENVFPAIELHSIQSSLTINFL